MNNDRYLIVGYTAKNGNKEFTSVKGYKCDSGEPIPSYAKIRTDCLHWANVNGGNFKFFKMEFMQFVGEDDFNSFFDKGGPS